MLTEHQSRLIERLVESGRYQNASEVLREGLRLVEARQAEEQARLEALVASAEIGIADIAAGRYRDFTADEALDEHLSSLAASALERGRRT